MKKLLFVLAAMTAAWSAAATEPEFVPVFATDTFSLGFDSDIDLATLMVDPDRYCLHRPDLCPPPPPPPPPKPE